MSEWKSNNIPDLSGKMVIITGANNGLGEAATQLMAARGAHIVMAVRTVSKGEASAAAIRKAVPSAQLTVMPLDLADLASVRTFAAALTAAYDRLDILMNNAGVMATPESKTEDGFELQLGTNHLGHFALTGLLIDVLLATPNSRIVNVSSGAADNGKMHFDDLMLTDNYSRFTAYSQSKLANLLFTVELQKRLAATGTSTIAVAAHPGVANSNLISNMKIPGLGLLSKALMGLFMPDSMTGTLSQVRAAADPAVTGGDYYGPDKGMRGWPVKIAMPPTVNVSEAPRLWAVSEQLTGVQYLSDASLQS
jgi:NAD(P)-dependent dehydrogenase (short-subunit alcohol dehydrogenase family)